MGGTAARRRGLLLALAVGAPQVVGYGSAVMYAASWVVLLHIFVGEYVFVKHLHAVSRNQGALDMLAFFLLLGGMLTFNKSALWCAFLAGAFALASMKYLLIERTVREPALCRYARGKVRWESPAVVLFALLAVVIGNLPTRGLAIRVLESAILAASALFAFWMIGVRHAYRRVADASKKGKKSL